MPFYDHVILGGGIAAGYAAQTFVEEGLKSGHLAIISAEPTLPYDRPPLSKDVLKGETAFEELLLNDPGFYRENGIDTYINNPAVRVDFEERRLYLSDGTMIEFEQMMIATGSKVRRFSVPGSDLFGVFYLRDFLDARQILSAAEMGKRAVVVGGSFIGMEVAAALRQIGLKVTMTFREDRVWQSLFTPTLSSYFHDFYAKQGIDIVSKAKIEAFIGQDKIRNVKISQGDREYSLPTDLVVAGIGVTPNIELFNDSDLEIDDGILVNHFLETNIEGVFAVGDIARYPDRIFDRYRRVEHWDNAVSQGRHAARMMMGQRDPFIHVSYFFSDVFSLSYEYWGEVCQANVIVYRGDLESDSFSVWWLADDQLKAAFIMDRPDEERDLAPKWIRTRQSISPKRLADVEEPVANAVELPVVI